MCEINVSFSGSCSLEEITRLGVLEHSDGLGFALLTNRGKLAGQKGVTLRPVLEAYQRLAAKAQVAIIHNRIATQGTVSKANTQPFISGSRAFAHNGHLGGDLVTLLGALNPQLLKTHLWSDSRLLWRLIGGMPYPTLTNLLLSLSGRFVLLDAEAERVLLTGGDWQQHKDGSWSRAVYRSGQVFAWVELLLDGTIIDSEKQERPSLDYYSKWWDHSEEWWGSSGSSDWPKEGANKKDNNKHYGLESYTTPSGNIVRYVKELPQDQITKALKEIAPSVSCEGRW